ncbi:MAG: O-antigen ligase family protein [Streptosporangiaceae bacterium]
MKSLRLQVTWPLVFLFVGFPVWWLVGVSAFTWPVIAILMIVALVWRRRTRAPVAFALWIAFLSWVLLSGLQLTKGTQILTFAYRLLLYCAAAALFLYVYNMPRSGRLDTKVLRILTIFWMVVVAGGYAGILLRSHTFVPPFDYLLPHGVRNKPFVQELVQPVFAEVQAFLGYPVPRPAAPFAYTNDWGGNIAALTPVAFAAVAAAGTGRWRRLVVVLLVLSIVPMVFSLDRGMFLSLAVGILYVTMRLAIRGRVRAFATVLFLAALAVTIVAFTPLGHLVTASFASTHGNSNQTRLSLYQQASAGAGASPLFGYGAPKQIPGQAAGPAIGTQGQLWLLLYSHGYPALIFFIGFFLAALWQTRHARGTAGLWLHAVPLVALSQIAVYGWLPVELQVVMVAAALAYRLCWQPQEPHVGDQEPVRARKGSPHLVGAGTAPRAARA